MLEIHYRALVRQPGDRLVRIDTPTWEGFCHGTLPLTERHGIIPAPGGQPGEERGQLIDILVLTLRQDTFPAPPILELVEPFRLSVDEHGFLQRLHINLDPLADPDIIDLRPRLVTSYLRRTYHWRPSAALIAAAMTLCGPPSAHDVRQRTPG